MSNVSATIEALIFASDEPLTLEQITKILEVDSEVTEKGLLDLSLRYQQTGALELRHTSSGYIIVVKQEFNDYLLKLNPQRAVALSRAALEVLAIVAFKQPITRVEVNAVRGVNSDGVINSLMAKGLIEAVGRLDTIGRPVIFGTTDVFLQYFGLDSIEDLPQAEDIKL